MKGKFLGFLTAALMAASPAANAQTYTLTDLDTVGASGSIGYGISSSGQVTGWIISNPALVAPYGTEPFIYSNGAMTVIGTPGVGFAINDAGQVAGAVAIGSNSYHAALYSGGATTDLASTVGGQFLSSAQGINNSGQIVGSACPTISACNGYLDSNGKVTIVAPNGFAAAINNAGQIAGWGSAGTAFLYSNGVTTYFGPADSSAYGISNSGLVTGEVDSYNAKHEPISSAFLYSSGKVTTMGTLGGAYVDSVGEGVNSAGQVVGYSTKLGGAASQAFFYSNGKMLDLNSMLAASSVIPHVTLTKAQAINDNGWIVADGYNSLTGRTDAFLLTPIAYAPEIDPRSAAGGLTLLLSGLAMALGVRRSASAKH
jgi:probable HAF family extracellular repeat protein